METLVIEEVSRAADRELRRLEGICVNLMGDYKRVGILGLAYKPGATFGERQGATLHAMLDFSGEISAHDPAILPGDLGAFVVRSDLLVLMTCWPEYQKLREMDLSGKCVIDMWGYLDGIDCDRYVRFGEGSDALV